MGPSALAAGNPDEDASSKAALRAARAQRFKRELPGNRYKELEEARKVERRQFEERGLITSGRVGLEDAIDMRGTCEDMCCEYEREFREFINSIDRFERLPNGRLDHGKAVAAYTRSEAGAGEGDAAVLPSDLRTPAALVRSLDYLFDQVMSISPPSSSGLPSTARTALGNSFGFIRDRTKAIRKEFAMQSSWGHAEAIASIERVARFHILCLRELQEETGPNSDMHQDADQLGRCFVSLRQHYNDRREEAAIEMPSVNEPEFQAYMLIFDLNAKTAAIQTSELPSIILDHPLVKLAWEIRRAAQRNFDTQKEGSKGNAELGMNLINRFVRLLKSGKVPYLLACLVEVRLREMRRSALRALQRTYPRLKQDPIRLNENGEIVERRMVLIKTLDTIIGCEEQEDEPPAFNDVTEIPRHPDVEAADVVRRFGVEVFEHNSESIGALINLGAYFNDNKDAPFTRRWKSITEKRGSTPLVEIVNGRACIQLDGTRTPQPALSSRPAPAFRSLTAGPSKPSAFGFSKPATQPTQTPSLQFTKPAMVAPSQPPQASASKTAFGFDFGKPAALTSSLTQNAKPVPSMAKAPESASSSKIPAFDFGRPAQSPQDAPQPKAPVFNFDFGKPAPTPTSPAQIQPPSLSISTTLPTNPAATAPAAAPLFTTPGFFNIPPAGPSKTTTPPRQQSPSSKTPVVLSEKALGKQPQIVLPSPSQSLRISRSISSSLSRKVPAISEAERLRRKRVAPVLTNEIITQVVESFMEELTPELRRLIQQENNRKAYEANVRRRTEFIQDLAGQITESLLGEAIGMVAKDAVLEEGSRRWLIRKTIKHWKSWAKRMKIERDRGSKLREETFERLARMGLGGDSPSSGSIAERRTESELGEMSIDVELREAARRNERFYAPSTFLFAIARHVAPLLEDSYPQAIPSSPTGSHDEEDDPKIKWNTVISVANEAGPSDDGVITKWLIDKFSPKDEEDELPYGGCSFATEVVGRFDETSGGSSTGLVVFEVPQKTDDPKAEQRNIEDTHDRITALINTGLSDSNRYDPVILLVTWQNESLEEIVERLEIEEDLAAFEHVGVLSLESTDDIETRLESLLGEIVQEITPKQRVEISLEDIIGRSSDSWARFDAVLQLVVAQRIDDSNTILKSLQAGIGILNHLAEVVKSVLGKKKMSATSTFDPIVLPLFQPKSTDTTKEAAEVIVTYLDNDIFSGIDDIALTITPLRHAASAHSVLPITRILASLAFLVFGEMRSQTIALKTYLHSPQLEENVQKYLDDMTGRYSAFVNSQIGQITSLPSAQSKSTVSNAGNHANATITSPASELRGTKRARDEIPRSTSTSPKSTESKSSKNARLRAALEEVNRTLEGIEKGWMDVEGVLSV